MFTVKESHLERTCYTRKIHTQLYLISSVVRRQFGLFLYYSCLI